MQARTLSPQSIKTAKFNQIKELQYFRKLFRDKQELQLKQILAQHVIKCITRTFDHDNYIYIAQKSCSQCQAGAVIDKNVKIFSKRATVYRVTQRLDKILRYVILAQIPVLCKYKSINRFKIYNQCEIQHYAFNRTVFRKGEELKGIFYIIDGQIKVTNDKKGNCSKIISKNNFIGLQELHDEIHQHIMTAFSNSNDTILLFISMCTLRLSNQIHQGQQEPLTLKEQLSQYFQQLHQKKSNIKRIQFFPIQINLSRKQNKEPVKLNHFLKRMQNFKSNTSRNDNGFNQYLKTKKVMLQLKQTMKLNKNSKYSASDRENLCFKNIDRDGRNKMTGMVSSLCRSQLWKSSLMKRLGENAIEIPTSEMINFGTTIRSLDLRKQ